MTDVATLAMRVDSSQVKTATGDLGKFGKAGQSAESSTTKMAKASGKAFAAMAAGAAAAAAAALSLNKATSDALAFGSALAEVGTLIDGTAKQTDFLRKSSAELAATYGGTGTQQAKAFYQAISAGASSVEEAATTLDTANRLAIGGVTDVTTAVGILSTAMNVYADSGLSAAEASDAIFVAVKAGVTTVGELSSSLGKVLPLAEEMGLTFDETAAATAALTKGGLSTAEAVTGLRASLAAVLGPTTQAADLAKELSLDFNAAGLEARGFAGFMDAVVQATGGSAEQMQTLFGSVEAVGAALAFSGSAGDSMALILEDMANKAGATSEAFNKMSEDMQQRLNVVMGELWGITTSLGSTLLTALVPGLEAAAAAMSLVAENTDVFMVAMGLLAAKQIPAAIGGLVTLSAWLATSEGLFIAGEVAARGMSIAMNLIPGVALLTGLTVAITGITRGFSESAAAAANYKEAIAGLVGVQESLNTATETYYQNMNAANLEAMKLQAERARDTIEAALDAAKAELEAAEWYTRAFGVELFDTKRTKAAQAAIQQLQGDLMEAEARLDAARVAAENMGDSTDDVTDSANAAATAAGKLASQLSVAASAALRVAQGLAAAPAGIQGFQDRAAQLTAQIDAIDAGYDQITAGAAGYRKELEQQYGLADAANEAEDAYISALIERQVREYENVERLNEAYNDKVTALNSVGSAGGSAGKSVAKGMKEAEKEAEKLADQIERLEFEANPIKKYNAELAKLNEIKANSNLTDGAYQNAVQDLNDELASQLPLVDDVAQAWGDWLSRGFQDFKSFADDILSSFTSLLSQMIATAARNRILFSLGIGGSVAGSAASAGGLLGGGGGGGGILGQLGGLGGGLLGTLGSTAAGTVGTGLIGGAGNALGIGLSSFNPLAIGANAAMAGGGIAATIGAALPVIGGVALAVSALKKAFSRRYYGSGIRGSLGADGADVQAFDFYKGGFFKSDRTVYKPLQEEMQTVLDDTVGGLTTSIKGMAETLGLASDAADDFNLDQFTIWTNDKSEQEIQEALTAEIDKLAAGMADLILTTDEYTRAGETSFDTLQRLSTSLTGVNDVLDLLGRDLLDLSLAGADAASSFVDLFGSIENLNASATAYYQSFYSEQERFERAFSDLEKTFEGMNLTLPKNRAEYRALIEAQDMATEAGRRMTAALLKMAPAFDSVMTAAANSVKNQITAAQQNVSAMQTEIGVQEQIIQEAQRAREGALRSVEQAGRAVEQARGQVAQAENQLAQARKAQAQFAAQDAADAAAARLDAAQDRLSALQDQRDDLLSDMESSFEDAMGIAERLAKTARNVMSVNEDIAEIQRVAALRQLRVMLETGRIDAERLDRLTDSATNFGDTFTSQVDLLRAQAQTAQTISALSELQEDLAEQDRQTQLAQLSALEAQLANAQDTIDAIEDQTAAQEAAARAAEARGLAAEARSAASAVSAAEANLRASERAAADAALQAQLTIEAADKAEAAAMEEIARLEQAISVEETQISLLQKQLNVLEQLLSSSNAAAAAAKAQAQAAKAQAAAQAQAAAAAAATPTMTASEQAVESIYQNTFGRSADQSGLNNYAPMLANNSITAAAIEQQLRNSAEGIALGLGTQAQGSRTQSDAYDEIAATIKPPANMTKTENDPFAFPGFADGGTHAGGWRMVGERGPELEYTGPSRIHSSRQSEQMLRDPELRKEMVKLNEYVRELVKINNKQERRLREIELQGIEA